MKSIPRLLLVLLLSAVFIGGCKKEETLMEGEAFDQNIQLEKDEKLIKDFISSKNITNAVRDQSGIYYVIINPGSGNYVYTNKTVIKVNYTGRFLNGEVFDSNPSLQFLLIDLITGWVIGIPKIQKGGTIRLLIPSGYAYGPNPRPGVPANSVLDFDIELLDVTN